MVNGKFFIEKIAKSFVTVGLSALVGIPAYEYGDEFFFKSKLEQEVEERIGKPIDMPATNSEEERSEQAKWIDGLYKTTRNNWDKFDNVWNSVSRVTLNEPVASLLDPNHKPSGGNFTYSNSRLYLNPMYINTAFSQSAFVHELYHAWYNSLPDRKKHLFDRAWVNIAGDGYLGDNAYDRSGGISPGKCDYDLTDRLAVTTCNGLVSLKEDVAEIGTVVYYFNHQQIRDVNFFDRFFIYVPKSVKSTERRNKSAEDRISQVRYIRYNTVPRMIKKVDLLREYGAISQEERDKAVKTFQRFDAVSFK